MENREESECWSRVEGSRIFWLIMWILACGSVTREPVRPFVRCKTTSWPTEMGVFVLTHPLRITSVSSLSSSGVSEMSAFRYSGVPIRDGREGWDVGEPEILE